MPPFTTLNGQTGYYLNGQFVPATQQEYDAQFNQPQTQNNPFLQQVLPQNIQPPLMGGRQNFVQQGTIQGPETAGMTNEQKVMQSQGDNTTMSGVGNMPYVKMGDEYGVQKGKSFFPFDAMTASGHPLNTATNTVFNAYDLMASKKGKVVNPFVPEVALMQSQNTQNALNALNNPITPTTPAAPTQQINMPEIASTASNAISSAGSKIGSQVGSSVSDVVDKGLKSDVLGDWGNWGFSGKEFFKSDAGKTTSAIAGAGVGLVSGLVKAGAPDKYDPRVGMSKPNLGGNLFGDATFTQMGLNPLLMGATGGLSAVVGGGVDLIKNAVKYAKQKDRYDNKKLATDTMQSIDDARENMKPDYTGYARFGTQVKNPYIKQYNPGGKVIVDGKEISTSSKEYKNLYDAGVLMGIDSDGLPSMYAPEVEITAKMTDEERERRLRKQYYDPNLTERENEKKYQAKKQIESWKQADINQPGGLQKVSEMMSYPFKVVAGSTPEMLEAKRQQEEERRMLEEYRSPEKQRQRYEEKKAKENKELDDRLNSAMIMDRYINEPLGQGTFPFQMRSLGNGLGGHNLWESLHLGAGMYHQNPQRNTQNPYAWLAGGLGGPKLVDENDPQSIYFIKKDLSKQKEYPMDFPIIDVDPNYPNDENINERDYIYDKILPQGYNYQPLDKDGFVHRNFTPEKDTLLGGIYIDPATLQKLAERYEYNDVELKKAIMRYAKINEDRITNDINNIYIHTNTIPPDAYETYRNLISKNNKLVYNWNEMYKDNKGGTIVRGAPDPKYYRYPKNANGGMVQNPYLKSRFGMETDPLKKNLTAQEQYNETYGNQGYDNRLKYSMEQSAKILNENPNQTYGNYIGDNNLKYNSLALDSSFNDLKNMRLKGSTAQISELTPDVINQYNLSPTTEAIMLPSGTWNRNNQAFDLSGSILMKNPNDNTPEGRMIKFEEMRHFGNQSNSAKQGESNFNFLPYEVKLMNENIPSNNPLGKYGTNYTEISAKKGAVNAYLIEKGLLKPGEDVNDTHFDYLYDTEKELPGPVKHGIMMYLENKDYNKYLKENGSEKYNELLESDKLKAKERFKNIQNSSVMKEVKTKNPYIV